MERTASIHAATILAFPVGGRRGARAWCAKPLETKIPSDLIVDCDAWYHQAAIRDETPRGTA